MTNPDITITQEMIDAGEKAILGESLSGSPIYGHSSGYFAAADLARRVYLAMYEKSPEYQRIVEHRQQLAEFVAASKNRVP